MRSQKLIPVFFKKQNTAHRIGIQIINISDLHEKAFRSKAPVLTALK